MDYTVVFINIAFVVSVLGGVFMTIMGLPGNILILLTGLLYGYYDHFENVDYAILVITFGIFIIGEIVEFISGLIGAKKEKASKRAMIATSIGTVVGGLWGTAIVPVIGLILGALVGAFAVAALAEYSKTQDIEQAKRVAKSVVKGQIIGILIKAISAVSMAIILIYQLKWH
jgi:uncharacterized protein YqgC (DUF456 family)